MRRLVLCILLAAAVLVTAACSPETAADVDAVRTATPMEAVAARTATPMEGQATRTESSLQPQAARTESPLQTQAVRTESPLQPQAARTESPLQTQAVRTESPLQTQAVRTESPLQTDAAETAAPTLEPWPTDDPEIDITEEEALIAQAITAVAQATLPPRAVRTMTPRSDTVDDIEETLSELSVHVLLPGDLVYRISPDWKASASRSTNDRGMKTYTVGDDGTIVVMYQKVDNMLVGTEEENREILRHVAAAEGTVYGCSDLSPVQGITAVPYAWISWVGSAGPAVGASGASTQLFAFSSSEYLYTIVQVDKSTNGSLGADWIAMISSLELHGADVWFDQNAQ